MRSIGIGLIVAGVAAVALWAHAGAQTWTQVVHVPVMAFTLPLGAPSAPARMTAPSALKVAEAGWDSAIFRDHPYTVRYGSYHSKLVGRTSTGPSPVGSRDVWAITLSGVDMQRPAMEISEPDGSFKVVAPPDIHTEIILVDDQTGKYLEGIGY
ncbi:MAG: hypothetical protein M3Z66_22150 [Chloroflexota bacterium]|nr:hypothetical protein [Chloroflexota bacterium]